MEVNIFEHLDYREYIQKNCKLLGISYRSLATAARMHGSYFSRVMKGNAIFSSSQLFLIGKNFKLSSEEIDYLLLLGEMINSANSEHQNFLKNKIKSIQEENSKLLNKFKHKTTELSKDEVELYYREAITAKIHMMLTLEKYRENPLLICRKTFITEVKLESEIQKLINLKIIKKEEGTIFLLKNSVHLDESHSASNQNHINWRLQTINHLAMRGNNPNDYHLSANFSCDEKTKAKIKEIFKKFVVEAQYTVRDCHNANEVYHIGMDLF